MKSNTFVTRLARGAVASTVVGTCFVPQCYSSAAGLAIKLGEVAMVNRAPLADEQGTNENSGSVTLTLAISPEEWTKQMEREFRSLALQEAKGELSVGPLARLEQLCAWRERLVEPRTTDEVLLQLRRDRVLEKLAEALKEYVEFQEGANQARSTAS